MNPETGEIKEFVDEKEAIKAGWIPIRRDLTLKEKAEKQIQMYNPCGCGSGKKFKFCCFKKPIAFVPNEVTNNQVVTKEIINESQPLVS